MIYDLPAPQSVSQSVSQSVCSSERVVDRRRCRCRYKWTVIIVNSSQAHTDGRARAERVCYYTFSPHSMCQIKGLKDGFKSLFQLGVGCAHKPHFFTMMTLNPILTVSRLPGGRCVSETAPEAALLFTLKRRFHQLQS